MGKFGALTKREWQNLHIVICHLGPVGRSDRRRQTDRTMTGRRSDADRSSPTDSTQSGIEAVNRLISPFCAFLRFFCRSAFLRFEPDQNGIIPLGTILFCAG